MSRSHLVVPLDDSDVAHAALPVARLLARCTDAELRLMTVIPPGTQPGSTRAVLDDLRKVAAGERKNGLVVHSVIRIGDPAIQIAEVADQIESGMIVMATHGRVGAARHLLGSIADRVLKLSHTPVALVRADQAEIEALRTLLVPVDGTPGGAAALDVAVPLARASGAALALVRAGREGERDDYTEAMAEHLRQDGLEAQSYCVAGPPAQSIVAMADQLEVDLVVMSTRGRNGLRRSVLGSVADQVVRESRRPVLVVQRETST